jgi:hypothetical protein
LTRANRTLSLLIKCAIIRCPDRFATPTGQPAESVIRRLEARLANVRLSDPIHLHAAAAAFTEGTNLRLEAIVGPPPPDLEVTGLPPIDLLRSEA